MGYFPKSPEQVLQMIVWKKQWIATRKDYIPNNGRLLDITDCGLKVLTFQVGGGTSDLSFTHAETTVHGATCGSEENHSVRVTMNEARGRTQVFFFQGIGEKPVFLQFA
jgi:hypothetical protein